jgi:hypothetical protein
MGEQKRKLARDATNDEIFPGSHGPVQADAVEKMKAVMRVLQQGFGPNYDLTLFVSEKTAEGRDPRFNYISTAHRADMTAVLRAFVAKHEAVGPSLDKIEDEPAGSA